MAKHFPRKGRALGSIPSNTQRINIEIKPNDFALFINKQEKDLSFLQRIISVLLLVPTLEEFNETSQIPYIFVGNVNILSHKMPILSHKSG